MHKNRSTARRGDTMAKGQELFLVAGDLLL